MNEGECSAHADHAADCGGPRRRDKEATKRALLDAARSVFAERGFDAATTREVAGRAGLNEQLIQRYFGGKAGLLEALVESYGREEEADAASLPPLAETLEAEIEAMLSHEVGRCWERRELAKVVMDRALVDPEVARRMAEAAEGCRAARLQERLETFRARGAIAADLDLCAIAQGIATLGFGLGFLDRVVFDGCPRRTDEILRAQARVLAGGLRPQP
ncbi:TetR/AcrR family transcriptional regulator [Arenibaculum pallidiluteum]|uniref:TetR/AcrR family transcriptional regulator n=1 Tax=Arenibaculum pallidiluteum TaxID=2812559 RepID=UPI001F2FF5D4|nr:TetR/AcrR family transcriptional regulator [Arenibaculum pallidiluteum]